MRGKRAKKLYDMAEIYVQEVEKKPLSTGYRSYSYIENRIELQPILDPNSGLPLFDPEGQHSLRPGRAWGTIFCDYLVRKIYKQLKKKHYAARRNN